MTNTLPSSTVVGTEDPDLIAQQFQRQMGNISRQSLVFFAGMLFTIGVGFLFNVYLSRVLGTEGMGLFALGMSVLLFFQPIASLGLSQSAPRFVSVYLGTDRSDKLAGFLRYSLIFIVLCSSGLGLLLFMAGDWIANQLYQEAALATYLPFFALLLPISTLNFFFAQVLQGYQKVIQRTVIHNFVQFSFNIGLTLALFALGWGLWGYLLANMGSTLVGLGLMAWVIWRTVSVVSSKKGHSLPSLEREVVSFAAYMIGIGLLEFLAMQADRVLLGIYLDVQQVGIYSVTITTAAFIPILLQSVNSIFGPVIAELYAQGKRDLLLRLFQLLTKWILSLTWPLVVVIILFAPVLMRIFGQDFEAGWPVLIIVAVGQLINVGVGSVGYLLLMSGNQRLEIYASTLATFLSLAFNLLLIPLWGIMGAALALAIREIMANLLRLWQVYQVLGMSPYNRHYLRLAFPFATSLIVTLMVRQWWYMPAWPSWSAIVVALAMAYTTFVITAFYFSLDDDDQLIVNSAKRLIEHTVKSRGA